MDEKAFERFLKSGGRSPKAIKRCLQHVRAFESFLKEHRNGLKLEEAKPLDLEFYIKWVETNLKGPANTTLWALRYFFQFTEDEEMEVLASNLREARIKRRHFPLDEFVGVKPGVVERLLVAGVKDVKAMLESGSTMEGRERLSEKTGVALDSILELVSLSDLARIPGVKGIRARLYYDAGVDNVKKLAGWKPKELRDMLVEFVERTGFEGIPPHPSEVRFAIETAKKLEDIVEF